jgi:general nucleoside transport system permease protein
MEDLFTETFLTALVAGGVLAAMPLLFASLGEAISEQAGVLNVGLEGMMLAGAYGGFVVALETDSTWLGLGGGMVVGALVSLLMVVLCVRMKLDQIVIGIGIVLVAEGLTSLLFDARYAASRPRLPAASEWSVPGLSELPVLGESIFQQHPIVYLGVALVIAAHYMLRRTSAGLSLRAAGEKPAALDAAGVNVDRTRTWATIAAGLGAGLGGAYLSVIAAGTFTPFMTQGQGFIAIVIAMLARGTAPWTILGALLFGMSLSVATALQLIGVQISTDYVQMLPFIAVIVVLVLFARRSYLPSALALPYVRGER